MIVRHMDGGHLQKPDVNRGHEQKEPGVYAASMSTLLAASNLEAA